MTDLAQHIQTTRLVDSHEHMAKEDEYVNNGPDVLSALFGIYIGDDLITAGASPDAVARLLDPHDPDVEGRWNDVKVAWQHCRYTGYGEVTRKMARLIYGIDEINLDAVLAADARNQQLRRPGERLRLLKEVAHLDHIQVDDFVWACQPDLSGPDFFFYDISWEQFSNGVIDVRALYDETHINVIDVATLRQAITALFATYAPYAVAVKSQHAYSRTLAWHERSDSEVEPVLQRLLRGNELSEPERLCLGDWCLARGVEAAIEHDLPFKIHTGYMAGTRTMIDPDRLRPGHLAPLLTRYEHARFVLMHTAYPYSGELLAVAKQFPGVYLDMCWAWSINPHSAADFVRRVIHTLPINKLFVFGGDCFWPMATVAYAAQAREGLTRALQAEIDTGFLTEREAIDIATRVMRENQMDCFNVERLRTRDTAEARLQATLGAASRAPTVH
jgi:predicted TIM-barrel fold metal-dependent hydrolase